MAAESLPRPQSIQYRAKDIESLRRRLAEEGKLSTPSLELDRRDLAGVRIIFYTNNDVNRFIQSSLVHDNFEVEPDSTKIYHPTPEKQGEQYRGIHYTVRLGADRIRFPEYAQFVGLRCEIQIQTILGHAWAETSHDILYKNKMGNDFGARAMADIKRRFDRIADKYLVPAGYELQKAQKEFEQLLQGKQMFDQDISTLLDKAQNNN
ncbi:GTP pyrophosphokinase, partial [Nitrospira sp. BLG_2]